MAAKKELPAKADRKVAKTRIGAVLAEDSLFGRVAGILEDARSNVVRAVNSQMVLAYWMIGREIVQEIQGGKGRAAYGKQVMESLSRRLGEKYGAGFSAANLKNFRQFYLVYPDRWGGIRHPAGSELGVGDKGPAIPSPSGAEFVSALPEISDPPGSALPFGFSPQLSWSHYRALMRVEKSAARDFYEREAIAAGWDKRTLERQIHSFYHERLLASQHPETMRAGGSELSAGHEPSIEILKNPYVLKFLALPDAAALHESDLENAILSSLQAFLLELGKGFAFVARQKRMRTGDDDRYVDLVFYHCHLKFYLLVDPKLGELSHADVGQMDGYVRMFDDLVSDKGDNPSIGLILCTEKNETVAKYSVLNDRKQIFASKYMLYLPTEDELRREIERERNLLETEASGGGNPP